MKIIMYRRRTKGQSSLEAEASVSISVDEKKSRVSQITFTDDSNQVLLTFSVGTPPGTVLTEENWYKFLEYQILQHGTKKNRSLIMSPLEREVLNIQDGASLTRMGVPGIVSFVYTSSTEVWNISVLVVPRTTHTFLPEDRAVFFDEKLPQEILTYGVSARGNRVEITPLTQGDSPNLEPYYLRMTKVSKRIASISFYRSSAWDVVADVVGNPSEKDLADPRHLTRKTVGGITYYESGDGLLKMAIVDPQGAWTDSVLLRLGSAALPDEIRLRLLDEYINELRRINGATTKSGLSTAPQRMSVIVSFHGLIDMEELEHKGQ